MPNIDLQIRLMGRFGVTVDGEPVAAQAFGGELARRVLRILAARRGALVTRDSLVEALWPDVKPADPGANLNALVNRVRRAIRDGSVVRATLDGYVLDVAADVVDIDTFATTIRRGLDLARDEQADEALDVLRRALGEWAEPLAEDRYEDWAEPVRRKLEALYRDGLESAARAALQVGDAVEAEAFVREAVAIGERLESAVILLARALAMRGERAAALDVLDNHRRTLGMELGLEPSPETVATRDAILRGDPDQSVVAQQTGGRVPSPTTALLGRERELASLPALLDAARLVTITGPGGVGKTRLATELARRCHMATVYMCALEHVDPQVVSYAVAHAVDAVDARGVAMTERIVAALHDQDVLLVLDGCDALIKHVGTLVATLLDSCPKLTVLVTSRERLGMPAEHTWPLVPLSSATTGDGSEPAAVELFVQRAQAADPAFEMGQHADLVRDVCHRLDGVPLAIELAAAQLSAMSLPDLHERLEQRLALFGRAAEAGSPLAHALDSSFELLTPAERKSFARLAAFPSDFALSPAEQVAAGESGVVAHLVDKSLVSRSGPQRYRLLETTRLYAQDKLVEQGGLADALQAHARYSIARLGAAADGVKGPSEVHWVAVVRAEIDDLRQAHRWAVDHDSLTDALELAAAVPAYAQFRLAPELFDWAAEAVEMDGCDQHRLGAAALGAAALGMTNRGELGQANELAHRALLAARDPRDVIWAQRALALRSLYEGDGEACAAATAQIEEAAAATGDHYAAIDARMIRSAHGVFTGADGATGQARSALAEAEQLGNPSLIALGCEVLGEALQEQAPAEALELLDRSIETSELVHCRLVHGLALLAASSVLTRMGEVREAARRCRLALLHWRRTGQLAQQWVTLRNAAELLAAAGHRREALLVLRASSSATVPETYGRQAERLAELLTTLAEELGDDPSGGSEPDIDAVVATTLDRLAALG